MADPNPLDSFLHLETDESAVNALVASLEFRLASPTHKEQSSMLAIPSVNSNHVSNVSSITACTSAQNNSVHLSNDTGNTNNTCTKTIIRDNQILGINSIHTNSPIAHANSPVLSHRTASPKPFNSVNKSNSPAIQVLTQTQNHGNHSMVANQHLIQATPPPPNSISVNSLNAAQPTSSIVIANPAAVQNSNALKHVNRTMSPAPQLNITGQTGIVQQSQPIVRNSQGVVINSNSQQLTQKTNVHIVHSANVTSVINQPGSNPSVITVRGPQLPASHLTTVRPQVVTTHVSNSSSPRPPGCVRIQNRMPNTPIRIASSQPNQQINIAPRPGGHPVSIDKSECDLLNA